MTTKERVEENRVVRDRLRARKSHVIYTESHSDDCDICGDTTEQSDVTTEHSDVTTEDSSDVDSESQSICSSGASRS